MLPPGRELKNGLPLLSRSRVPPPGSRPTVVRPGATTGEIIRGRSGCPGGGMTKPSRGIHAEFIFQGKNASIRKIWVHTDSLGREK
jgi:hypothetical protein